MYNIVVITHQHETFSQFGLKTFSHRSYYLLSPILRELESRGYTVRVVRGLSKTLPRADVAILHVDATFTPVEYVDYARSFPFCINIGATDISKRQISGALLENGEPWQGPVVVKSNLNFHGYPETSLNNAARSAGSQLPFPTLKLFKSYQIYESLGDVPQDVLDDNDLVVEKFIAEEDRDGYAVRFWLFCGNTEWCKRYVFRPKLFKAGREFVRHEPVPVPQELRDRRRELKFDYGKFDFVVHEGRAVLLDANKTVGINGLIARAKAMADALPHANTSERARTVVDIVKAEAATLADGFESLIKDWVPHPRGGFFHMLKRRFVT